MPRGGWHPPSNAKRAAVSNPGSGKRTDGMAGTKQARQKMMEIPANGQYGYRSETASMAAPQGLAAGRPGGVDLQSLIGNAKPLTPITAPTQFPGRPVTHGYSYGPGDSPAAPLPSRFAAIDKYRDQLETMAANGSPGMELFYKSLMGLARNG